MKTVALAASIFLVLCSGVTYACATLPESDQRKHDQANLTRERLLAAETARKADVVFIGTVEPLEQAAMEPDAPDHVVLLVVDVLKGSPPSKISLPIGAGLTVSCNSSDMFHNSSFQADWSYIVYVSQGQVLRAARVDRQDWRASISFAEERSIVVSTNGT